MALRIPDNFDSEIPPRLEPIPEDDAFILRKLYTNSETMQRLNEATAFLPDTPEGAQAMFNVHALLDEVHTSKYDDVERLFRDVRRIFQFFKITVE